MQGAAIATGNACVVKMSELTPNVAAVVTELLPKYLDQDLFRIVNGGILETTAILELQWDHSKLESYNRSSLLGISLTGNYLG